MIDITDRKINDYLLSLSGEKDKYLLAMERVAKKKNFPIVGRLVGKLLYLLTKLKDPELIVELGSGFGYSAYWFAKALDRGKVVLIDYREDNIAYARDLFHKTGFIHKAEFRTGNALEIAQEYENIDIVFIDIDKHQYCDAVDRLIPKLNRNALIVADNSLWYGRVAENVRDKKTREIKKFNRYLSEHPDFVTTILPLRDGVLVAYKHR